MAGIAFPKRGEVYLVTLDPTVGHEISKTRLALILQNNVANKHSPITIVGAITSKFDDKLYATEVLIHAGEAGLKQDSVVRLDQIRSVDRVRLVKKFGNVSNVTLKRVDFAIKVSLGLVDF